MWFEKIANFPRRIGKPRFHPGMPLAARLLNRSNNRIPPSHRPRAEGESFVGSRRLNLPPDWRWWFKHCVQKRAGEWRNFDTDQNIPYVDCVIIIMMQRLNGWVG